ncbi:hypothetical protein DAPPUDRAFT_262158 [Daphnia pulex]|nr:hypothetical protein DAPPUDRAFT_262158 [Daphnia pulex]|eukprot:EFX67070.1 hypothetical protein DAPPUDRAFT_262158 [Daphnia pulex]
MFFPGIAECILLVLTIICSGAAHNILVLTPITTPSHSNVFEPLVAQLADRGHFVTYTGTDYCHQTNPTNRVG